MKSRTKSARIIKMPPAAENAIDDEDALTKAIAASWAAVAGVRLGICTLRCIFQA